MMRNRLLWVVQGLLAVLFLFTGGVKLALPAAALQSPVPLPVLFVRFIGVCEILGAIGLILPGLLRIHPELTPLAAAGLFIIMCGATAVTAVGMSLVMAIFPFVVLLLVGSIAWGRWRVAPIASR